MTEIGAGQHSEHEATPAGEPDWPDLAAKPWTRAAITVAVTLLAAALGAQLVHALWDLGPRFEGLIDTSYLGVQLLALVACVTRVALVARERLAWALISAAVVCWIAGDISFALLYEDAAEVALPSISDLFFLSGYPCVGAAVVLLARERIGSFQPVLLVDGLLGALAVAAVTASFFFNPIVANAGHDPASVATIVAYPILDLVILGAVVGVATLTGWRPGRAWAVLGAALAINALADLLFAFTVSVGEYGSGNLVDWLYSLSIALLPFAAWQRPSARTVRARPGWTQFLAPALFALAALAILVIDHYDQVPEAALILSALTLLVSIGRATGSYGLMRALDQSRRDALTDPLTAVANRAAFTTHLDRALSERRATGGSLAVLFCDLNDFKAINDSLGHLPGDRCLRIVASRAQSVLRQQDLLARLGGDEFAVLIPNADSEIACAVAERLSGAIREPMVVEGRELMLGLAVGIAISDGDDATPESVLRDADLAMYEAKTNATPFQVFSGDETSGAGRVTLAAELRHGIGRGELEAHFQPKARLDDASVHSVEALVRWRHPTRGLLAPREFLSIAERSLQMPALTDAVIDLSLAALAQWRRDGAELGVAINLPGTLLRDRGFTERLSSLLEAHRVPPTQLTVELIEDAISLAPEEVLKTLGGLAELGVGIAIDDFGQGHSSLGRLRRLPIDELKIDRAFVAEMHTDEHDAVIVRSTINLAHDLGLRVVAEGVEDSETLSELRDLGCDEAQGYFIARPMTADRVTDWLSGWQQRHAGPRSNGTAGSAELQTTAG